MAVAEVVLWGRRIGAVSLDRPGGSAVFEYEPEFAASGFEPSPLVMPVENRLYQFPELSRTSFGGLPGLVADSLPDKFGNAVIDRWLEEKGIDSANFDNVERLMYIGSRGMGALEYSPDEGPKEPEDERLNLDELHRIAAAIIEDRNDFSDSFDDPSRAVMNLFLVGSSAGGARPKAILAWNPQTNEIRSGRAEAGAGFEYWLLKFDGVREFSDREFGEGLGYGKVEFAYHEMAAAAGINLAPARLLNEDGRSHFMTKRFDRSDDGRKTHMLTLAALCHYDFEQAGAYSYEQCFGAIRRMGLGSDVAEQQFRRMAFNAVARNQDDHVKNIAFLMDRAGEWSLSPAYDVTHSYKPTGVWTSQHQMSINGRRDGFERTDFKDVAETASMPTGRGLQILDEVVEVVSSWSDFAEASGVTEEKSAQVAESHRLSLGS